ncbi:hypothetical protein GCM10020254_32770 [Streptomyces goshikiensis]
MSDSQQTDPAPLWWSRPDGLADARRDGVPAPRPHAEGDTAAGGAGGAGASSPDPSEPGTEAGSGPRYDPWAVRPLHVVDTGRVPRGIRIWQVVAISLGAALLAGGTGGYLGVLAERRSSTRLELPQAAAVSRDRAPESVAGIAAGALPGVVTLHVSGGGGSGTGTGFVLDPQGHILTNNHVVADAKRITVTFSTGESVGAELVGRDSGYDLAVVKVTGVRGLRPLTLGNSENVKVGDPVVAIGAPFDLSNTVTAGIISATGRPITAGGDKGDGGDVSYVDALQTDAPHQPRQLRRPAPRRPGARDRHQQRDPGRRRGPGRQGRGAAERQHRPRLRHPGQPGQARRRGTDPHRPRHPPRHRGHPRHAVHRRRRPRRRQGRRRRVRRPPGPGARAGIRPGDVITKVDGQRVHGGDELIIKIRAHRPGDALKLTVLREGREHTLDVVLGSSSGA